MNVTIIADSACDLSRNYYNEFDIKMVPLNVHLNEKEYKDGETISPKVIYDAMRHDQKPKTSQVTPQTFKDIFLSFAKKGQSIIYLAFSSRLSGTYQTAKLMAAEVLEQYPNTSINIIDTKCASIGYGLVTLEAAKLAKNGASVTDIINQAVFSAQHMEHIFTVDDLKYLYHGGRVSRTQAVVGSLLKIKPILHVDDGKLIPLENVRGSKKLFQRMMAIMEERGTNLDNQVIGISHGDDLPRAEKLAEIIREKYHPKDIIIEMVGSVIGAHSGPGTLALFFLNDTDKLS